MSVQLLVEVINKVNKAQSGQIITTVQDDIVKDITSALLYKFDTNVSRAFESIGHTMEIWYKHLSVVEAGSSAFIDLTDISFRVNTIQDKPLKHSSLYGVIDENMV